MRDSIASHVKETLRYTVDSFANVLSFDLDPDLDERDNVTKIISHACVVCSVVACTPIPLTEFLVLTPIHAKMTLHIGRAKGFAITQERAVEVLREVALSLGASLGAGALASFVKFVPVVGWIVYVPIIYGTTLALGRAVEAYFDGLRTGQIPTAAELRELFSKELTKGKAQGASLRKEQLEKAYQDLKKKIDEREKQPAPRDAEAPRKEKDPTVTPSRITIKEKPSRRPVEKTIGDADLPADPAVAPVTEPIVPASAGKTIGPASAPPAPLEKAPPPEPARVEPKPEPLTGPKLVDELERLVKLRDLGALTPEEFEAAKKKLLQG